MKFKYLVIAFIGGINLLFAQKRNLEADFFVGAIFSELTNLNPSSTQKDFRLGFNIHYLFEQINWLKIESGIGFTKKGDLQGKSKYGIELQYFELPVNVLIEFPFRKDERYSFFIQNGIYLSKLIDQEGLSEDSLNKVDVGLNLGLGFNVNRLLFSLQYQIGFPSVIKGLRYSYIANRNLSLMLGYRILKPKKEIEPSKENRYLPPII